jgi:hypothetical protein
MYDAIFTYPRQLPDLSRVFYVRAVKVGGLTFIRLGRLQLSFCVVNAYPWAHT